MSCQNLAQQDSCWVGPRLNGNLLYNIGLYLNLNSLQLFWRGIIAFAICMDCPTVPDRKLMSSQTLQGAERLTTESTGLMNGTVVPDSVVQPPSEATLMPTQIADYDVQTLSQSPEVYNRELSWLDFNWRVLQHALDPGNPLLERLNFLGITAANMDEFFRKRVGGLKRQLAAGSANLQLEGWSPSYQLGLISQAVSCYSRIQDECFLQDILPQMGTYGIRLRNYADLSADQAEDLRTFFLHDVFPLLTPLAFDSSHPFPFISNMSLNLAVYVRDPLSGDTRLARVKVPPDCDRWIPVGESHDFVPLEQVLIHNLDTLFVGMEIVSVHPFRITRNADMKRNEDEAEDLLAMISEELHERRFAPVVRLEVSKDMTDYTLGILMQEFGLAKQDVYRMESPLGLSDFMALYQAIDRQDLKFSPWQPRIPASFSHLTTSSSPSEVFQVLKKGDILLHHPYQSFTGTTQLLFLAATRDPKVLAIKHTMYRTTDDSPIVDALINAAENGKQVAVLVEVKARFDEEQNIHHSKRLEDAGCHVAYGLIGLKAHTKISLIVRQEAAGLQSYVHIGTGNYNPSTANLYTDLAVLTTDKEIVEDVMDLFNYLTGYSQSVRYKKLLVAPVNMRQRFIQMVKREMQHVRDGHTGHIIAKMNSLDDSQIVKQLYQASRVGVRIDLIVRGVCRIRPGIPGISDNITVTSIIGRFLEHHRIFYFRNVDQPEYYLGSADWMQRNLDHRVEAIVPITHPDLQSQLQEILDVCLQDRRTSWHMREDGRFEQIACTARETAQNGQITPAQAGTHAVLMYRTAQKSLFA